MHHSRHLIHTIPGHVNLLGISLWQHSIKLTFETVYLILIRSQNISANVQCSLNHHVPTSLPLPRPRKTHFLKNNHLGLFVT